MRPDLAPQLPQVGTVVDFWKALLKRSLSAEIRALAAPVKAALKNAMATIRARVLSNRQLSESSPVASDENAVETPLP
jgi:hypothetical protein